MKLKQGGGLGSGEKSPGCRKGPRLKSGNERCEGSSWAGWKVPWDNATINALATHAFMNVEGDGDGEDDEVSGIGLSIGLEPFACLGKLEAILVLGRVSTLLKVVLGFLAA